MASHATSIDFTIPAMVTMFLEDQMMADKRDARTYRAPSGPDGGCSQSGEGGVRCDGSPGLLPSAHRSDLARDLARDLVRILDAYQTLSAPGLLPSAHRSDLARDLARDLVRIL